MALSVSLTGSGTLGPVLPGWSVTEDATPVAPGDTGGGTGSVSFSARHGEDSEFVIDNLLTVTDTNLGTITGGKISNVTSNGAAEATDTTLSLTGTTGLNLLNSTRSFGPVWAGMNGTVPPIGVSGNSGNQINSIYDIAVDSVGGFVYIAGSVATISPAAEYARVLQYRTDGGLVGSFGNATFLFLLTDRASALAIVPTSGDVLVGNAGQIQRFDRGGNFLAAYGSFGSGDGQYNTIKSMTADSSGNIYIYDDTLLRLTKLNSSGVYQAKVTVSAGTQDIAVFGSTIWSKAGATVTIYNSALSSTGTFAAPNTSTNANMAPDPAATGVWIADGTNAYLYNASGTLLDTIGLSDAPQGRIVANTTYVIGATSSGLLTAWPHSDATPNIFTVNPTGPTPRAVNIAYDSASINLQFAVRYYLDQFDPSMTLTWNASINPDVEIVGYSGEGWVLLKQLAAAYGIEFAWVADGIVARDLGTTVLSLDNVESGSVSLTLDSQASGRSVDFQNYNTDSGYNVTLFDASTTGTILQVNPSETVTQTIQTTSYPTIVSQPTPTDVFPAPPGTYRVMGSDNLPVVAAQWTFYGGSVSVGINPDSPNSLDVTITAPASIPGVPAPYSFAVSDGSTNYPQFSVIGSGVTTNPETVNILAGADWSKTTQEVAASVDNVAHSDLAMIYKRCTWALTQASGPRIVLSATVPTSATAGFGLTEGSLVSFKESTYRVTSANIGNALTEITASRHVTVAEFDVLMAADGVQVGEFDTFWAGNDCEDLKIKSLRRVV